MEWISVKEKLPEKPSTIDVFILQDGYRFRLTNAEYRLKDLHNKTERFEAYQRTDNGMSWINITNDVTHWMPLPEPPKQ